MDPTSLSAAEAARAIASGALGSEELVRACLQRIDELEPTIAAWAFLDRDRALAQARAADLAHKQGRPHGPLHGVPVGVKDIFDTADMPTEDGTVLHAGRRPTADAAVVALLREAGAVVLGKTVTTELAVFHPGKTRNPHDPARTPGGSSSGSAAAVAAGMVPLAIGSQTNGSVIRPASYCGVFGYKPSRGLVSRHGVLRQSERLDHVGVFARSVEDLALIAEPLMAFDARDPAMRPQTRPGLVEAAATDPPVPLRFAFVKSPVWDRASPDTHEAFAELVGELGDRAQELELAEAFGEAIDVHRTIHETDLARAFAAEYERGADKLSAVLRQMIERGQRYLAVDYNRAVERIAVLNGLLDKVFDQYDAILTPAATGEASVGLESTGSPVFCTTWTLCGVPSVTVPILQGAAGMPIGVQVVGSLGDDARLLRAARWLANAVAG